MKLLLIALLLSISIGVFGQQLDENSESSNTNYENVGDQNQNDEDLQQSNDTAKHEPENTTKSQGKSSNKNEIQQEVRNLKGKIDNLEKQFQNIRQEQHIIEQKVMKLEIANSKNEPKESSQDIKNTTAIPTSTTTEKPSSVAIPQNHHQNLPLDTKIHQEIPMPNTLPHYNQQSFGHNSFNQFRRANPIFAGNQSPIGSHPLLNNVYNNQHFAQMQNVPLQRTHQFSAPYYGRRYYETQMPKPIHPVY